MLRTGPHCSLLVAAIAASMALAILSPTSSIPRASASNAAAEGWTSSATWSIAFLGRDGPNGTDHYLATVGWGASFFAIAVDAMPLVAPPQAVQALISGYQTSFPYRGPEGLRPGDSFEFQVPVGTLVCAEWRRGVGSKEYRSLRGDSLIIYTSYRSPISYRLMRVEDPNRAEIQINLYADPKPVDLARELYGEGDPEFTPDFLQVQRARDVLRDGTTTVNVDLTRKHLDDFREVRGSAEPGGKSGDGLDIYWFRSAAVAQPLFRVEDGVGDSTDSATFPSPMRVYYYKDGVVRTWLRASDTAFLSGRQPKNDLWAKVFSDYGRADPSPARWELGQPEQDAAAQELSKLGIVVLRFQPKEPPQGNFFTRLLDFLFAIMKRKES